MITWVDIYPLTTGNIILIIRQPMPPEGELTVVVKKTGFSIYCEKEQIGEIENVDPDILKALAASELLGMLEWPEGGEEPDYLDRYAKVVDKTAA
ncbi:MAG: hypothetical protein KI792_10550 [Alphaproteobacteria bacterium]|nr:hypothetical protein [Alphaproteobacteria bacterium SS10]